MDFKLCRMRNNEEQLEELVDSFRSSFWMEEHQWFVRCDWISSSISSFGTLYTLPYAFEEFMLTNNRWSKSTTLTDHQYNCVRTLTVMNFRTHSGKNSARFSDDFGNIHHLQIHLPLNDTLWSLVQSLNQLTSLDVMLFEGLSSHRLQLLLNRSPSLSSLCLGHFNNLQIVSQLSSASISRLDFLTRNTYKRSMDSTQCDALVNSALGRQCQVLLIKVEKRTNILQLIKEMPKLRSVTFQTNDDQWKDELVQWLGDHLPSTCSVIRDPFQTSNIRLWIN